MALPVTGQSLIPKAPDEAQASRAGEHGNVFPLLVALEDLDGHVPGRKFLVRLPMLENRLWPVKFMDRPQRVTETDGLQESRL